MSTAILAAVSTMATAGPASALSAEPSAARGAHPASTVTTFSRYRPGARAVTYDVRLVPTGAGVRVTSSPTGGGATTTELTVHGLAPHRAYGAHVHLKSCGASPEDAGSHFQYVPDPVKPSVNPRYSNSRNEIWLDFVTDARGNGHAVSSVPWQFTDRHAGSVVVHTERTRTDPGHAGEAGARLACVDVNF